MAPSTVRILLVEDNPGDARLVEAMLNESYRASFLIQRASSIRETLVALNAGNDLPEIILLDLGLPDEQGLQTLRRVLRTADGVPIVVLTGLRDEEIADAAVREGAQDFLYKEQLDGDRLRRVIRHAIERHRLQSQIRAALMEKEVLLREVYHRVKNNLQVIQSLLKMQARSLEDERTRQALGEMAQRVYAMALVHEKLCRNTDLAAVSISAYVGEMFEGALSMQSLEADQIRLELDVENIPLSFERAVPFGLLLNELICNSLKHGFPDGRKGTISISLHRAGKGVQVKLKDDGIGLLPGFDPSLCSSMGLQVATSLARQLRGELTFSSDQGCRVEGTFSGL